MLCSSFSIFDFQFQSKCNVLKGTYEKIKEWKEQPTGFLTMKSQWVYGLTLLPWCNHFHTSIACHQLYLKKQQMCGNGCTMAISRLADLKKEAY